MTHTGMARAWIWAALPLGALVAGCDAGPDAQGTEDTQVAVPELVASVRLSATHDVKFWYYGDGLARIEENMHLDLDRGATLSMNKIDLEGRALADVYEIAAGATSDPKVVERLHAIDLRLAALARITSTSTPPGNPIADGPSTAPSLARSPAATAPRFPSAPDGLELRQGAQTCAEPAGFNWQTDGQYSFAIPFCISTPGQPVYECEWAKPAITEEWTDRVRFYRSIGLNQSFCSPASYGVWYENRPNFLVSFSRLTILSASLPTRWVRNDAWFASGDAHFMSRIESTLGGTTVGLGINITSQI